MSLTWRLLKAGREVGRIELGDDGTVQAQWPPDMPRDQQRSVEEGRESVYQFGYSDHPRPEMARWPEYWHWVLNLLRSSGWWDQVETNFQPPEYPVYDEEGNPIVY
nr:MAG: hypothetical protein DIU70_13660 [Bacillota bacterium]